MEREHIRTWTDDHYGFRLELYDTFRTDWRGQSVLAYEFFDEQWQSGVPVFEGEDFSGSPLHADDSDATIASLLGFLSLREGDTDSEYFDMYCSHQIAWRDDRAEELSLCVYELEYPEEGEAS